MTPPGNAEATVQFLAIFGVSCAFVLALFAADFAITLGGALGAELVSRLRHRRAQCRRVDRWLQSDGGA